MATLQTPDTIIIRIHKLLALANNNPSETEAALAAEHVQRLLQDYGLTLAQVEAAGGKMNDGGRGKHKTGRKAMYGYQRNLMAALAELHFCLHLTVDDHDEYGRKSKRHVLVGRRINVEATSLLYDYLLTTMKRLVLEAGHAYGKTGERDLHWWLDGCSGRLCERLQEKRKQNEAESAEKAARTASGNGSHRELILSDVYGSEADLNNDSLNGFPAGTTATRRREANEKQARQQKMHDQLVAEGVESDVAWYRSFGYGEVEAKTYAAQWKRRMSRSRGGRGRTRNWTNGDRSHKAKINSAAYQEGRATGGTIGLDNQVGRAETKRIR